MLALLLSAVLLVSTPVSQDSVSAERFQRLEDRVDELETTQEVRKGYYLDTLSGERIIFGTFLTLLIGLGGLVGFGVFQRRVNQIEETLQGKIDRLDRDMVKEQKKLEDKLEGYFNNAKMDIDEIEDELKELNVRMMEEQSEIYSSISKLERGKGDYNRDEYIRYELKGLLKKVKISGEKEPNVEFVLDRILREMRNMYESETGILDSKEGEIRDYVRELMDIVDEESQKKCFTILEGLDSLSEFDVLPF